MKWILGWLMMGASVLAAHEVTVAWDASPDPDVAGYRVYYGTNSRAYGWSTNAGLALEQTVRLPWSGHWYFAATTYDDYGVESDFSNEADCWVGLMPPVVRSVTNVPASGTWVRVAPVLERSTNLVDWTEIGSWAVLLPATEAQEFFRVNRIEIGTTNLP
jgi:hypothetical protein